MTDREALAAALEKYDDWNERQAVPVGMMTTQILAEAARERLAQLPEMCDMCGGGRIVFPLPGCPKCHGSGRVYPAELVERIGDAVFRLELSVGNGSRIRPEAIAVAVLDALNGES